MGIPAGEAKASVANDSLCGANETVRDWHSAGRIRVESVSGQACWVILAWSFPHSVRNHAAFAGTMTIATEHLRQEQ